MSRDSFDEIVSLTKRRGFIFQSSEIYGGMAATYDYGPLGVELKRNVKERWWREMVYQNDDIEGLDSAIMMHPEVWKASGHVEEFNDPMIDDKVSNSRYRADDLIEWHIRRLRRKEKYDQAEEVEEALEEALNAEGEKMCERLHEIVIENEFRAPDSGAFDWTKVRMFNLMFETHVGPVADSESRIYLRPETAQGIFVNFQNVQETARQKIPFGIAQMGKAFRNEIVARQFIFRTREFEQMEMQYFVKPGTHPEYYEEWRQKRMEWHVSNGIRPSKLRFHEHKALSHYAEEAHDIQYEFPTGWQEIEGIHSRTDFDLRRHQELSGKKMEYFEQKTRDRYIPYVVETSAGLDRTILMLLSEAYEEEEVDGSERTVMKFHPDLAPITAAIFPLVKNDEMQEVAHAIEEDLRDHVNAFYDERGNIGRRYRRMDEAGTPFCITVDGQTEEDNTVTIRDRDSMEQVRVTTDRVVPYVLEHKTGWTRE
jgi:glycyl-tRNA synthetase